MAERAGLRPGDTILEVNGTPFRAVTHEEALKVSAQLLVHSLSLLSFSLPSLMLPLRNLLFSSALLATTYIDAHVQTKR